MIQHNQWAHLWQLDKSIAYLNHGGYGSVPVHVQEVQNTFQDRASTNPNKWFRSEMPNLPIGLALRQSTLHLCPMHHRA
jgi:hypothetical protein